MAIRRGVMLVLVWLAVLLLLVIGFIGLIWAKQESVVFQPPDEVVEGGPAKVRYVAEDGQPLLGYVIGDRQRARHVLVAFHGNAELAAHSVWWAEEVARRSGWLVLLAEYRGYAGLAGRPSYRGSKLDARAAYAFARDTLRFPPERIGLRGFSLGSAVATELATDVDPAVLILEAPLSSARDMARIIVARPLHSVWDRISRVHFDTERRVAGLDAPVWVAHGEDDFTIPARMGRAVFAAAKVKGEMLLVPDATHNEIADRAGAAYWRWLEQALASGEQRAESRASAQPPPNPTVSPTVTTRPGAGS